MDLTNKQKIILVIITAIIVFGGCYYIYSKDSNIIDTEDNDLKNLENIESNSTENNIEEQYSDAMIIVHVSGAVNKEGIVELKVNSRIDDAIEKAGGLREDAYIDNVNLAYVLEDGMKIYIPNIKEKEKIKNEMQDENTYVTNTSGVKVEKSENNTNENSNKNSNKKVNINEATQSDLETLPGIGPSTASKIITYRKENGKFKSIEDIKNVSGIGDSKYNSIKDLISIK